MYDLIWDVFFNDKYELMGAYGEYLPVKNNFIDIKSFWENEKSEKTCEQLLEKDRQLIHRLICDNEMRVAWINRIADMKKEDLKISSKTTKVSLADFILSSTGRYW